MKKFENLKYQWKGFEFNPEGCLLDQLIDLDPAMGIAYERSCGFYKDFHTHDRLMLVIPRGSCVMEIRTTNPKNTYRVDSNSILLLPTGIVHDDKGISSIYDTLALYPSPELVKNVSDEVGLNAQEITELNKKCIKLGKSQWLEQLILKYFFNRVIAKNLPDEYAKFFEIQILTEIFLLLFKKGKSKSIHSNFSNDSAKDITSKALNLIEANIFEKYTIDRIAKQVGASTSTLLRKFKNDLGQTPYAYIKNRRLDEAMRLLQIGDQSVGEVALLVGYENFGSFSEAFKKKFRQNPSSVKNWRFCRSICHNTHNR